MSNKIHELSIRTKKIYIKYWRHGIQRVKMNFYAIDNVPLLFQRVYSFANLFFYHSSLFSFINDFSIY